MLAYVFPYVAKMADLTVFHQLVYDLYTVTKLKMSLKGCYPNSTGGLQCHCEEHFSWPCDKCNVYGACNNATGQTCGCINGRPSDGQFCEPITSMQSFFFSHFSIKVFILIKCSKCLSAGKNGMFSDEDGFCKCHV